MAINLFVTVLNLTMNGYTFSRIYNFFKILVSFFKTDITIPLIEPITDISLRYSIIDFILCDIRLFIQKF